MDSKIPEIPKNINNKDNLYEMRLEVKSGINRIFVVIDEIVITELILVDEKDDINVFIGAIKANLAIEKQDDICLWLYADEIGTTDYTCRDLFVEKILNLGDSNNEKQQNQVIVYPPENIDAAIVIVPRILMNVLKLPRVIFLYKEPLLDKDLMTLRKLGIKEKRSKFACTFHHSKLTAEELEKLNFITLSAYWYGTLVKVKYTFPKASKESLSNNDETPNLTHPLDPDDLM